MLQNGWYIGSDVVFSISVTENERRVFLGGHDGIWQIRTQNTQSITAFQPGQRLTHRTDKIAGLFIIVANQIGHHFRIRLGIEFYTLFHQLGAQFGLIFDDAVVHHSDLAAVGNVGVAVCIRRRTMGRPTGMSNAHTTGYGLPVIGLVTKYLQSTLCLGHLHFFCTVNTNTCGVISPVFQLRQSLQQNGSGLAVTCISDYSTHRITS